MNLQSVDVGDFQLTIVSGGKLRSDGGTMFGVVPRVLWEKACPPDEKNRILLDTNCLVVRTTDSLGLVDAGYGDKASPKVQARHDLASEPQLPLSLAAIGILPEDIDWVILTHLHFDHAGGCTWRDAAGQLRPTFPRAKHFIQRIEWEDATSNRWDLAGAYFTDDFLPLAKAGLVQMVEDVAEIAPGIALRRTDGHTRGHQIATFTSGGQAACYLGDLCPLVPHLRTFWSMAYDQYPLTVRTVKPAILGEIADRQHLAVFSHDPQCGIERIRRDVDGDAEWIVESIVS